MYLQFRNTVLIIIYCLIWLHIRWKQEHPKQGNTPILASVSTTGHIYNPEKQLYTGTNMCYTETHGKIYLCSPLNHCSMLPRTNPSTAHVSNSVYSITIITHPVYLSLSGRHFLLLFLFQLFLLLLLVLFRHSREWIMVIIVSLV